MCSERFANVYGNRMEIVRTPTSYRRVVACVDVPRSIVASDAVKSLMYSATTRKL